MHTREALACIMCEQLNIDTHAGHDPSWTQSESVVSRSDSLTSVSLTSSVARNALAANSLSSSTAGAEPVLGRTAGRRTLNSNGKRAAHPDIQECGTVVSRAV